jgi:hypothetical protein
VPSIAGSFDDAGSTAEDLIGRFLSRAAGTPASDGGRSPSLGQHLQQERQRRLAAETAAAELRQQLDDISAALFAFHGSNASSTTAGSSEVLSLAAATLTSAEAEAHPLPLLRSVLHQLTQRQRRESRQAAAQQQLLAGADEAAADQAMVARLVAGMLARAATTADLEEQWNAERALLERRLEQAAHMGQAMLRHHKEHGRGGLASTVCRQWLGARENCCR